MKRLYFIRHGETEFNRSNKWSGATKDIPLTEKGHAQAKKAGQKMKNEGLSFDVIVSSPLKRTRQTAHHIAEAHDVDPTKIIYMEELVERNFGILDGKQELLLSTKYFFDESAIDDVEQVERLEDLQNRVNQMLEHLQSLPHDTILVVGHGAYGRALRRAIKKEPLNKRGKAFGNAEYERLV